MLGLTARLDLLIGGLHQGVVSDICGSGFPSVVLGVLEVWRLKVLGSSFGVQDASRGSGRGFGPKPKTLNQSPKQEVRLARGSGLGRIL